MNSAAQHHPFDGPVLVERADSWQNSLSVRPKTAVIVRSFSPVWQKESPRIEIVEKSSEYQLMMPLCGIEPRNIYVVATPRSLVIEIRFKSVVRHQMIQATVVESIDQRIEREFSLPVEIERDTTKVRVGSEFLHLTARKSQDGRQRTWSQLIHFDTRAPMGRGELALPVDSYQK